jgi:glutamate/tyrosine decarboxylase-like PLP-dependent enzyme
VNSQLTTEAIRAKLAELEARADPLEPDQATLREWSRLVSEFGIEFVGRLPETPAYSFNRGSKADGFPISEQPGSLPELLAQVDRQMLRLGLNPASGGHLGYIPGGGVTPSALGDFLAAITNQYAGVFFAGPGAVRMENDLIRWLCELVGYPESALGNLASGGSIANLIAFVTARDAREIDSQSIRRAVIYLTAQVHHCVHKAIRIGGLSEAIVRNIPLDERFRMRADLLAEQVAADLAAGLKPFLVVASAGTTDTGAIDPLGEIATICQREGLWLHVDAAYGGFFLLADDRDLEGRSIPERFAGISQADSIAIDPHKGLFLSYGLGAVLVRDVAALQRSHRYQANYMQDTLDAIEEPSPAELSPELTKHFRGLRMWLPLRLFGISPFRAALEEKLWLCRLFYQEIRERGFEVGPPPELSVCIYRYVPSTGEANEFNRRLVEAVHRDGRVFISSTTIAGQIWLRLAVLSFRTHQREIDYLLELLTQSVNDLVAEFAARVRP